MVATHDKSLKMTNYRIVITNDYHRVTIVYRMKDARARVVTCHMNENLYHEDASLQKLHRHISLKRMMEYFI